ncbi:fumarylacetoacetate hydrolase family protein (plasmid) [Tistrella bauzanensis]|uniref:Fumarylacetoacetate hydrolase family protein n=1 Tax=Tistrella arctica TaxID=3133430 RepID=A0ABU9YLD2_9PROT
MKFVTFTTTDTARARIGALDATAERVVDLTARGCPETMAGLIADGADGLVRAAAAVAAARGDEWIPLDGVRLAAPLPRPGRNIFCVGKNYHSHAEEFHRSGFDASSAGAASAVPEAPIIFSKAPSTVIAAGETVPGFLDDTATTDYEGEIAVVIGKGGRGITPATALEHVWGYTLVNDVTARQLQRDHKQWLLGKSIDGFCPMGPWLATPDELGPLADIRLKTWVNDELRQNAVLADLIFDIPTIIATISRRITLEPGDVIATGTPDGVGIGFTPPKFLKAGDVVRIEATGLGTLVNPVG